MILAPRSAWTRRLLSGPWCFAIPALLYAWLIAPHVGELLPLLMRPEWPQIQALLSTPLGAALAWLHFLAFDLFIGRWICRQEELPNWILRPVLGLTLMLGPVGLLSFVALRPLPWKRRPLLALAVSMLGLAVLCLLGLALDPRVVTGLPLWIKPLKFALSVLAYALTLEWILGELEPHPWLEKIANLTAACLGLEMGIIVLQAARGTTSHFNLSTPWDGFLFALMGLGVSLIWVAAMLTCWRLYRQPNKSSLRLALTWGTLIGVVGMGLAWPMTVMGQHTVGAPDGGPGLPLLGWSTAHGDLRVPHFVGLHGIQWMAFYSWGQGRQADGRLGIHLAGLGCLGVVLLLTRQAFAGHSFIELDPALAVWIMLVGSLLVFLSRR